MTKHGYKRPWAQHFWTDEEDELLWGMYRVGIKQANMALELGMTHGAIAARIDRLRRLHHGELLTRDVASPYQHNRASQEMLDERERRREASYRRDIGSELMGDPPVGYSALDQRKSR